MSFGLRDWICSRQPQYLLRQVAFENTIRWISHLRPLRQQAENTRLLSSAFHQSFEESNSPKCNRHCCIGWGFSGYRTTMLLLKLSNTALAYRIRLCSPSYVCTYVTQSSLGRAPVASRKQVTVANDDGRVNWKDLTTREKAARTTQKTFHLGVVLTGLVMTVWCLWNICVIGLNRLGRSGIPTVYRCIRSRQ